jgi:hypothetical protein
MQLRGTILGFDWLCSGIVCDFARGCTRHGDSESIANVAFVTRTSQPLFPSLPLHIATPETWCAGVVCPATAGARKTWVD